MDSPSDHSPSFITEVASGTLAGLIAGALLLTVGYLLIDRRVHLKDALDRQKDREQQRKHNLRTGLQALYADLKSAAATLTLALETLPKGEVPYPLFDTGAISLVFEPAIFTTLQDRTVNPLLQVRTGCSEPTNSMRRSLISYMGLRQSSPR